MEYSKLNTMEHRERLAREQVDSWDMNDLIYFATNKYEDYLSQLTDEEFALEWKTFNDEE